MVLKSETHLQYQIHKKEKMLKLIFLHKSTEKTVYINVYKGNFDVVVLNNKQLEFSNSFYFETQEDFIYYILFVAEQLALNTEEFPLFFIEGQGLTPAKIWSEYAIICVLLFAMFFYCRAKASSSCLFHLKSQLWQTVGDKILGESPKYGSEASSLIKTAVLRVASKATIE